MSPSPSPSKRRVALLATGPADEAAAAWQWLGDGRLAGVTPRRLSLEQLGAALPDTDLLWIHTADEPPPLPVAALRPWLVDGGRLLLTQRATTRVVALGLETDGPNEHGVGPWAREAADVPDPAPVVRGLAAYGPHPLFAAEGGTLRQGAYLWAPAEGEGYARFIYARGKRPVNGHVVACERGYIRLAADRAVAWEYRVGSGGVLCIGAFVVLAARDPLLARQLRGVLANAVAGDAIPHAGRPGPVAVWPLPGRTCVADPELALAARPSLDGALPGFDSPLHVSTRALADDAFTLAGRRVFVAGGEQSGIGEIWAHPYRVLRRLQVTVGGETPLVRDAQITPAMVQRHLVSRARIVEETVTTALEHAVVLLDYRPEKIGRARGLRVPAQLTLQWTVDLRRMWPYPAGGGGDLRYHLDADHQGLTVADTAGGTCVAIQTSRPVEWTVSRTAGDSPALQCRVQAALEEPLRLAIVAGNGRADCVANLAALERRGVSGIAADRARHEAQVREFHVRVRTPDEQVNIATEWAKVRLDACLVDTPGVGRSLVAGYAASRPGWGDGRPGYAWYFGRDACWCALASLGTGDFATARQVLKFLGATQDVTGKVIHEVTTSGLAHYDAADSTPLYLLLAGRYAAWTGDLEFLAAAWPQLERAFRFCLATDSDGDDLIENARVGHGWIEMGPLAGARVTLYLAAIWIAALESLAPLARALGHEVLSDDLQARAARARAQAARQFRTGDGYALGLLPDGTPQRRLTALTAVPLLLDAVDRAPAAAWFDAIAGPDFSTPWGVRLLGHSDPLYAPTGYHTGAVWPLFTGWVSLAEYAAHRGESAFRHLLMNARLPFARQRGAFDEVLHGEEERGAGICPDQAWSAAMLLTPLVDGLLGARPDALRRQLTLSPHLPASWPECEWRGLRVGATSLDVRVRQREERLELLLRRTAGPRLALTLSPALPPGRVPGDARVDEQPVTARGTESGGCRHAAVTLELDGEHQVEIWHRPG